MTKRSVDTGTLSYFDILEENQDHLWEHSCKQSKAILDCQQHKKTDTNSMYFSKPSSPEYSGDQSSFNKSQQSDESTSYFVTNHTTLEPYQIPSGK